MEKKIPTVQNILRAALRYIPIEERMQVRRAISIWECTRQNRDAYSYHYKPSDPNNKHLDMKYRELLAAQRTCIQGIPRLEITIEHLECKPREYSRVGVDSYQGIVYKPRVIISKDIYDTNGMWKGSTTVAEVGYGKLKKHIKTLAIRYLKCYDYKVSAKYYNEHYSMYGPSVGIATQPVSCYCVQVGVLVDDVKNLPDVTVKDGHIMRILYK